MRKSLFFFVGLFLTLAGVAQIKDPVQWTFSAKKINATTYEVRLTASIESGWHIYSQTTPEGGPVPTGINFSKNPLLTMTGRVKEVGKLEKHHEPLFGVDVKQFSNNVDFVQLVSIKGNAKTSVTGYVEYMVCDDKECLPPKEVKFSIPIK